MRGTKYVLRSLATVAVLGLVLAACSSDSSSSSAATDTSTSTSTTSTSTSSAAEGTPVTVTIGETDVQHMYMKVDPASVAGGTVTFTVTNEGVKKHEFVILQTDVPVTKLDVKDDEVIEDNYTAIDEIEDIAPGATETLTVTLDPGHYDLICNLKGHYRMGMYSEIDAT